MFEVEGLLTTKIRGDKAEVKQIKIKKQNKMGSRRLGRALAGGRRRLVASWMTFGGDANSPEGRKPDPSSVVGMSDGGFALLHDVLGQSLAAFADAVEDLIHDNFPDPAERSPVDVARRSDPYGDQLWGASPTETTYQLSCMRLTGAAHHARTLSHHLEAASAPSLTLARGCAEACAQVMYLASTDIDDTERVRRFLNGLVAEYYWRALMFDSANEPDAAKEERRLSSEVVRVASAFGAFGQFAAKGRPPHFGDPLPKMKPLVEALWPETPGFGERMYHTYSSVAHAESAGFGVTGVLRKLGGDTEPADWSKPTVLHMPMLYALARATDRIAERFGWDATDVMAQYESTRELWEAAAMTAHDLKTAKS